VSEHDVNCFLNPSAAGHDILRDDKPFVRPDLKPAPQDKAPRLLFGEDVALSQGAAHFLADNNSTEGRGDDGVAVQPTQLVGQPSANITRDVGVLEEKRTLKKLPAVKSRSQNEMALQQCAGFPEEREQVVASQRCGRLVRLGH
jgi:hypothetical protein